MAIDVLKKVTSLGIKTAALMKAFYMKYQSGLTGLISINALRRNSDIAMFRLDNMYRGEFEKGAAKAGLVYSYVKDDDPNNFTVAVRTKDIALFNYVNEGIGLKEEDVPSVDVTGQETDEFTEAEQKAGREYMTFTVDGQNHDRFTQLADKCGLHYATLAEVSQPSDFLKENEALVDSFDAAITSKGNGKETPAMKYWPQLKERKDLCVVTCDVKKFKDEVVPELKSGGMNYAVYYRDGVANLALKKEDAEKLSNIEGVSQPTALVNQEKLESRRAAAPKPEGDVTYVIPAYEYSKAERIVSGNNLSRWGFQTERIAKEDKFYESINHRIKRVMDDAAKSGMDKTREKVAESIKLPGGER